MILHNNRLFGRAHASRSPGPEVQTPPHVQPYNGVSNVNTSETRMWFGIGSNHRVHIENPSFAALVLHQFRAVSRGCRGVVATSFRAHATTLCAQRVAYVLQHAMSAINVQPNGNAPLSQGRRLHRSIDRVENARSPDLSRCSSPVPPRERCHRAGSPGPTSKFRPWRPWCRHRPRPARRDCCRPNLAEHQRIHHPVTCRTPPATGRSSLPLR